MGYFQRLFGLIVLIKLSEQASTSVENRISNGQKVSIEDYPYQVALLNKTLGLKCGGSIISKLYILTAGHCVVKPAMDSKKPWEKCDPEEVKVLPGKTNIEDVRGTIECADIKLNPKFSMWYEKEDGNFFGKDPKYDIAIVKLEKPLKYSKAINSIRLPSLEVKLGDYSFNGKEAVIIGYGYTINNTRNTELYAINIKIDLDGVSDKEILTIFPPKISRYYTGTNDGDSGSPLVINGVQYGISSSKNVKKQCPKMASCEDVPVNSFANVIYFRQWISENSDVNNNNSEESDITYKKNRR